MHKMLKKENKMKFYSGVKKTAFFVYCQCYFFYVEKWIIICRIEFMF